MSGRITPHDATGVVLEVPGIGIMLAYGTAVPSDDDEGYGTGCIFCHTDGGDGTALYVNEGTSSACDFNAITVGA